MALLTGGRGWAALALAALGLAACSEPTALEIATEPLAVHGMLRAHAAEAAVLVTRVRPPRHAQEAAYFEPVQGAEVLLVAAGDTFRLAEGATLLYGCAVTESALPAGGQPGCYAGRVPDRIRPGVRYQLRIVTPAGEAVRGEVVVPLPPTLLAPAADARVPAEPGLHQYGSSTTLPLRWRNPAGSARLEMTIWSLLRGCGVGVGNWHPDINFILLPGAPAEGASPPFTYADCVDADERPVPWSEFPARIRVTAYDDGYARYMARVLEAGAVRASRASTGLTGAIGVFGAAAIAETDVRIVHSGSGP